MSLTDTDSRLGLRLTYSMEFEPLSSIDKTKSRIPNKEIFKRDLDVFDLGIDSAAGFVNKYRNQTLIICGGGPSLKDTVKDIRKATRISNKVKVMACNRTHDWLIKKGLKPHFGVMIDPKPWCANYMTPTRGVVYLLGAKVDPAVWERFKGHPKVYHWHPWELREEAELIRDHVAKINQYGTKHGGYLLIPGMSTVGLRAVNLGFEMGFRKFQLHGFDSSKSGDQTHAYEKYTPSEVARYDPWKDNRDETVRVSGPDGVREYVCTRQMARQIEHFKTLLSEYSTLEKGGREYSEILIAGHGALPYLAAAGYGLHVRDDYNENPSLMPM